MPDLAEADYAMPTLNLRPCQPCPTILAVKLKQSYASHDIEPALPIRAALVHECIYASEEVSQKPRLRSCTAVFS
jgi:hypothetical protein